MATQDNCGARDHNYNNAYQTPSSPKKWNRNTPNVAFFGEQWRLLHWRLLHICRDPRYIRHSEELQSPQFIVDGDQLYGRAP
jgi:hypothetical protein